MNIQPAPANVSMDEHFRLMQAHGEASNLYGKAVQIIEVMKSQIGQVNATLAETSVELAISRRDAQAINEQAGKLEKRAIGAEAERDTANSELAQAKAHIKKLETELAEATTPKQPELAAE